jgi:hypothetical protein
MAHHPYKITPRKNKDAICDGTCGDVFDVLGIVHSDWGFVELG